MTARGTDQSLNGARALITGGFGFVGSQLCRALVERGSEVAVLDDLSVGSAANLAPAVAGEVRQLVTDVRDVDAVERHLREFRPTRLFHLAAVHFIPTCETQPTRAVGVNVTGTQSVLEACARTSVESVVVASSGAVYAPAAEAHTEDDAVAPADIYGYTKEWTEKLARYFYDRTSTPVGIARIFNVIGPGETNPHLLPAISSRYGKGANFASAISRRAGITSSRVTWPRASRGLQRAVASPASSRATSGASPRSQARSWSSWWHAPPAARCPSRRIRHGSGSRIDRSC
jgi:nucleoside-diphosphate-sugar epimerase